MTRLLFASTLLVAAAGCGDDAPAGTTCAYGGSTYAAGETFPSTDGCNSCSCSSTGEVACTLAVCIDGGGDANLPDDGGGTDSTVPPTDGGGTDATVPPVDGGTACTDDAQCEAGAEWCVGGVCVPCDNSGLLCDIACADGWDTYMRNGCSPCACAPPNECDDDADCTDPSGAATKCYAGEFCWDWCPAGDPKCCFGNICSAAGCDTPPPVSCRERGCPEGQECGGGTMCFPSNCFCSGANTWGCTRDCIRRSCITP